MKFCGECGKKNKLDAQFCFNCGSKFTAKSSVPLPPPTGAPSSTEAPEPKAPRSSSPLITPTPSSSPQAPKAPQSVSLKPNSPAIQKPAPAPKPPKPPRKPISKKTKRKIGIGAAVSIVAAILMSIPWPIPVTVTVELSTPNGGVFNKDCSLTEIAKEQGADKLTLTNTASSSSASQLSSVTFNDVQGVCKGEAFTFVARDTEFKLAMFGKEIGILNAFEISKGGSTEQSSLSITRNISGVISISTKYSNCKKVTAGIDCSVPAGTIINADLHSNIMTCSGAGKFQYLNQATLIKVTSVGAGAKSNSIKLSQGKAVMSDSDIETGKISCTFKVEFKSVANSDKEYTFHVGTTKFTIAAAELAKSEWKFTQALN